MSLIIIKHIRQGEFREYRITRLRSSPRDRYRVESRNPHAIIEQRRWWQFWRFFQDDRQWRPLMTQGLYHNEVMEFSSCHDAEATIDSDARLRIGQAEGWVPVRCADEGADNR